MEMNGNTVIVTGGGSGMGAATAKYLSAKGARVALLDINTDAAVEVAKEIDGMAIACDVTSENSVITALDKVEETFQTPKICVNCAGIVYGKRIVGRKAPMPLEEFSNVINVNLIGTFNVMRLTAERMSKQSVVNDDGERGVIINTASVAAFEGQIGQAAYSASKGGIVSLTLPAARELAKFGIRVMTIAPGLINTPMMSALPEAVQVELAQTIPFPKRLGHPEEYAKLVAHIVENVELNGEVIRLDGGLRMQA